MRSEPNTPTVAMWMGQPVEELSKEELLKVVDWCCKEIQRLQEERAKMHKFVDYGKLLRA